MHKFAFVTDLHWGYAAGRKPIHNLKALNAFEQFVEDFQPDTLILGGDMLDCSMLSHWNKESRRDVEGLRILNDARELDKHIARMKASCGQLVYIIGNHEDWLDQLEDKYPGLDGLLDVRHLLPSLDGCKVVERGGSYRIGKLWFIHGDQFSGGEHIAKKAVEAYGRNIRFGHFHTAQVHTKFSALDAEDVKTGICVPGLCKRNPSYGKGSPNRWTQGFLWGHVWPNGHFNDQITLIVDNKFIANGKEYKG